MDTITKDILDLSIRILKGDSVPERWNYVRTNSARAVEVPWLASLLNRFDPDTLLDVGIALSSLDELGLLLEARRTYGVNVEAVDIVDTERVKSRYPEEWWDEIESVPLFLCDLRDNLLPRERYDFVSCISVIEHIGFDVASVNDPATAFVRPSDPAEVVTARPANTDRLVLSALHGSLKTGGLLALSAPVGFGGPVLLRDSLGFYCAQWEYRAGEWNAMIGFEGFKVIEQRFYGLDEHGEWIPADSAESLSGHRAAEFSHSRGVGLVLLEKL